jgi:HEAT repeat protein
MRRCVAGTLASTLALCLPSLASAQGPTQPVASTTAPAGTGQRALTVALVPSPQGYQLLARTCPTPSCPLDGARPLAVQPPGGQGDSSPRLQSLRIAGGRTVVHVDATTGSGRWQAIVAAPLGQAEIPTVLWSGLTPEVPTGADSSAPAVQVTLEEPAGLSQVLVGETNPNLQLCGRPTLLSPRVVHSDLTLRPVKLQRLTASERDAAEMVTAARSDDAPTPLGHLLVAVGASSGYGAPGALTDGNPETFWSEGRGKEGRGEFVVLRAPADVPLPSVSFVVRPPTAAVEHGASPRSLFLAADGRLVRVALPEDAWKHPGGRYTVRFGKPLVTSCVAVVLDDAYAPAAAKDARVTLAEVTAYSAFDGSESHASLAEALGGDEARALAATAVLMRGGKPAAEAVAAKVGHLNASGRHLAMQVLDAAPCQVSSPVFASLLVSEVDTERAHAQDRVQRCGRAAADALEEVLTHGAGCAPSYRDETLCARTIAQQKRHELDPGRLAAANELATVAPERVVPRVAPMLGDKNRPTRRALRHFLGRAASKERGRDALSRQLMNENLPVPATIDLLRVAKEDLRGLRGPAGVAFARLSTPEATPRTRYLLQEPAARLAAEKDGRALWYLRTSMASDPEPMVRAQAVTVARGIEPIRPWLLRALEDDNVRVRQAAALSLAGEDEATPHLVRRLMLDAWPMVRAAAARALATTGPSPLADRELGLRLRDDAPLVRQWAATAIGARGVMSLAPSLRTMADEAVEKVTVRIAAVHALGVLCDPESADLLTVFAVRSADPYSPEAASGLGAASVAALGRLHPPDLRDRLAPLLSREGVPAHIQAAATAALGAAGHCSAR